MTAPWLATVAADGWERCSLCDWDIPPQSEHLVWSDEPDAPVLARAHFPCEAEAARLGLDPTEAWLDESSPYMVWLRALDALGNLLRPSYKASTPAGGGDLC